MPAVGVFDSGIGGFTILREMLKLVSGIQADYISDDSFAPYGTRSDLEITKRSLFITDILLKRGADLVVVACNSATAASIEVLREKHPGVPFVGVEPYINVLNHGNLYPDIEKAAVVTTVLTGSSKKFRDLKKRLDPENRILHFSLPGLASTVERILERGLTTELHDELRRELHPLRNLELSHLILGCTHYPLVADLIRNELNVTTISPAPCVAERVRSILGAETGSTAHSFSFLSTGEMKWTHRTIAELESMFKYGGGEN